MKTTKSKSKKSTSFIIPKSTRPFVKQSLLNVVQYCRDCLVAEGNLPNSVPLLHTTFCRETGSSSLTLNDFKRMLKSLGLKSEHRHVVEISESELRSLLDTPLPDSGVPSDSAIPSKRKPKKPLTPNLNVLNTTPVTATQIPVDDTLDDDGGDGFDPPPPPKPLDADDVRPFSLDMSHPGTTTAG
jgi:hypothetical protein